MNITPQMVYWITRLDGIHGLSIAWVIIGGLAAAILLVIGHVDEDEEWMRKPGKIIATSLIVPTLLLLFVPTFKEAAAIYLIPKMVNSSTAKNIMDATDNASTLLKHKVGEWLAEEMKEKR